MNAVSRRDLIASTPDNKSGQISSLIAERRRLDDEMNNCSPADLSEEYCKTWLQDVEGVASQLAEAPIQSRADAMEVLRFVDSRLVDDQSTPLDHDLIRNVIAFMERRR